MLNKMISILAITVITLPLSTGLLINGSDNLLGVCTEFFRKLMVQATRFGMN